MKRLKLLSLILALLLLLTSCKRSSAEVEKGAKYLFVTGKNGGTYNSLGGAMAKVVDKYLGSETTVISTGGSVDNIEMLVNKDAQFAFCQSDIFYYAINGKEMYDERKQSGLSVLAKLYTESVQIVVNAGSDIETIGDLVGRTVAVGNYGSATEAAARQILEAYGVSYDQITVKYQTFSQASTGLAAGSVDAVFAVSAMPSGNIAEYATHHQIRFLPISTSNASRLKRTCPFFSDGVILSETYGTANSVSTLNIDILLICRSDLSDLTVYSVTSSLFNNLDELATAHYYGNDIFVETASEFNIGSYHGGAKQYYSTVDLDALAAEKEEVKTPVAPEEPQKTEEPENPEEEAPEETPGEETPNESPKETPENTENP